MMRIRWSTVIYAVAASLAAGNLVSARGDHKGHGGGGRAPTQSSPSSGGAPSGHANTQNHAPSQAPVQSSGQSQPQFKIHQGNANPPQTYVPQATPKIHFPSNSGSPSLPATVVHPQLNVPNYADGARHTPGISHENRGREHLPLKMDTPITGVEKRTTPLRVPTNGGAPLTTKHGGFPAIHQDHLQSLLHSNDHRDLQHHIDQLRQSPDIAKHPQLSHLNLDKISGLHQNRLQHDNTFQHWQNTQTGRQLNLDRQFQMQRHGDLTRRMDLSRHLINAGGWQHRHHGAVAAGFTKGCFSVWYAGGGCFPRHCWYPRWTPWVRWCWWDTCRPFYDPRPLCCRPVIYQPCQPWIYYQYPIWQPLPAATCGTWVDVDPIVVPAGLDLQLLAVRFVDNGHPEQNLGPRYRIWVRNNSSVQITSPFSVLMMAANDVNPAADLPQAGAVIPVMDVGETKPIDIRLPIQANRMGTTPEGYRVPFSYLHVLVDSDQQIAETDKANNGAVVARTDILPVDPAAFTTDLTAAAPGGTLTVAGEGFGPEPGRVLVSVDGQQTEAVIEGWYDLGVRFTVPNYTLTGAVDAEILVIRGDDAASNPLTVQLAPQSMLGESADIPVTPGPDAP